ncbi:competence protein CoiA [Marinobacterium sedimentorum]|uniref:competence protein CoiA n=1 Tax=Marinobacterium sedimentorum TaxID=2927804 RepID=UPI0020C5CC10|nr:competence protein CoiA family protein [Marinobacterium sedimentorum]MCP8685938.1 hypothetical protein [Marinobacterium sedimentorum]
MTEVALNKDGNFSAGSDFDMESWELMKKNHVVGDFSMLCCGAPAIPKTSANGLRFFSHYSDECASAPETIWHLNTKESFIKELRKKSIQAKDEVPGGLKSEKWKADIYFEYQNRKIVFEVQHSYQHLSEYFKRQERYINSGVECYWVLYKPRFITVTKSILKYRLKEEFGNVFPTDLNIGGGLGQISILPIVWFDPEDERPIKAPGFFSVSTNNWIDSILKSEFSYSPSGWNIY